MADQFDADSEAAIRVARGTTITAIVMDSDELRLVFANGTSIRLFDDGQACCENRYMSTDDDLASYVGAHLLKIEVCPAPDEPSADAHEVQFLIVRTDKGCITVATHNEHNGYYGGFNLRAVAERTGSLGNG